ncbi:hypothetical protein FHR92_004637 [Fontibacillus solani]|uniref:Uncharacterized protein n=1 Tax=Fontibacillus solani TaxID=1572857 RepID=A0A7W3SXM5_9BACL|nr:hypothetical protein [Fontibacillus solani]MBA9088141.1 hypothetical protein [Fontibacillus solani]
MPTIRRLFTDHDFHEAVDRKLHIRIFRDSHLIEADSFVVRFTDETIITQSSVSDLTYHPRKECQFFELKK